MDTKFSRCNYNKKIWVEAYKAFEYRKRPLKRIMDFFSMTSPYNSKGLLGYDGHENINVNTILSHHRLILICVIKIDKRSSPSGRSVHSSTWTRAKLHKLAEGVLSIQTLRTHKCAVPFLTITLLVMVVTSPWVAHGLRERGVSDRKETRDPHSKKIHPIRQCAGVIHTDTQTAH